MPSRTLLILASLSLAASVLASPANAAPRELWPGVTYEYGVQFTPRGPVAISVLLGPRPGGLTTLEPVLSNDTVVGRETLTAMQKRLAPATAAGVNGDYFTFSTGRPSGALMRDAQLVSPPNASRASLGLRTDGSIDVRRVGFAGTWRATVQIRPLAALNAVPAPGRAALFTDAYGPAVPPVKGGVAVVLFPFPAATPEIDLVAQVVEVRSDGGEVAIPPGGAVLLGRGASGAELAAEAPLGATLTTRLALRPAWPGVVAAIGGGPQIVRDGAPIFRSGEAFTTRQLGPRAPRSAVGQLPDGRIVLVAVDGRQPGYSIGLTNFELAQALVRLGAVTGMGLDSGGSTTMAFDGALLNRPSDGRERGISTALMFLYRGVFVPEPPPRVSPNGDGVAESPELRIRVASRSTLTATLQAPDGSTPVTISGERAPGTYLVAFPAAAAAAGATVSTDEQSGTWTLDVKAVDELGNPSQMTRTFVVDDTLGFLRVPRRLAVPRGGREIAIGWRLFRPARANVTVLDAAGRVLRRLAAGGEQLEPGEQRVTWDGLGPRGGRLAGRFTVKVAATSALGTSELTATIELRPAAR